MLPDFCQTCNAQSTDESVTLSQCSRCKVVKYCSVDCQKQDWKAGHKKQCAEFVKETNAEPQNTLGLPDDLWNMMKHKAHKTKICPLPKPTPELREKVLKGECDPIRETMTKSMPGNAKPVLSIGPGKSTLVDGKPAKNPPRGLSSGIELPFAHIDAGTWLHGRAEVDVYKLLIDIYRLRVVQDQRDREKVEYPEDPINGFKAFLKLFDNKRALLPEWWTEDKAEECVKVGEGDGWSSLHRMIVKKDVIEHYGDQRFGLQLRLFGEKVYGTAPAESPGLWQLMALKPLETMGLESGFHDEF